MKIEKALMRGQIKRPKMEKALRRIQEDLMILLVRAPYGGDIDAYTRARESIGKTIHLTRALWELES